MAPPIKTLSTIARLSGQSIVSTASSYIGSPYAWIGDTPATGFSCTGFVHWVYSQFGYNTSEDVDVLYNSYTHVASGDLQPGDVLIFANTYHAGLSHAAIYIGGGQMIGADNFTVGVHVDDVFDSYWGPKLVGGLRVLTDTAAVSQSIPATTTPQQPAIQAVAAALNNSTLQQTSVHTVQIHSELSAAFRHVRLSQELYRLSCEVNVPLRAWSWYWLQRRAIFALR